MMIPEVILWNDSIPVLNFFMGDMVFAIILLHKDITHILFVHNDRVDSGFIPPIIASDRQPAFFLHAFRNSSEGPTSRLVKIKYLSHRPCFLGDDAILIPINLIAD